MTYAIKKLFSGNTSRFRVCACAALAFFGLRSACAADGDMSRQYVDDMLALRIPARLGQVDATENHGSGRLQIIISTQNGSAKTCENVNTLLEIILDRDKPEHISIIAVPGAEGELRRSLVKVIDDEATRRAVAANLEACGLLSSAGYAQTFLRPALRVFGTEDIPAYARAVTFLAGIYNADHDIAAAAIAVRKALDALKPAILSPEARRLTDLEEALRAKDITFIRYCLELKKLALATSTSLRGASRVGDCAALAEEEETIDPNQVKVQSDNLANLIRDKGESERKSVAQLDYFRQSEMVSELEYLSIILNLAKGSGISVPEDSEIVRRANLLSAIQAVDLAAAAKDAARIVARLKEKLLTDSDERLWDGIALSTRILNAFLLLRPSEEDMDDYKDKPYCFSPLVFEKFFARHLGELEPAIAARIKDGAVFSEIFAAADKCREFFLAETKADGDYARKTAQYMDEANARAAIILVPPHRIKALTIHARKHRYSYMVIRPVSPLPDPEAESALSCVLTDTRLLRFVNPLIPRFNPYMRPDESYAPFLAYVPPKISKNVTLSRFISFFPSPDKAVRSLMLYKSYTAFVRELGPVFVYICSRDEKLAKFLDSIRADISAGRIDTVDNANRILAQVMAKIKENPAQTGALFSAINSAADCALKITVTKTAFSEGRFYMIIEADLKGLKHEWALNISARATDEMSELWHDPDDFDESATLSAFTEAGREGLDDLETDGMPGPYTAPAGQEGASEQDIIRAVIEEFIRGVKLKQETISISAPESAGAHVLAQISNRIMKWKISAEPRISLPELTYETEMYLLNSLPPETILDEEVEAIFFNLTEIVPMANRLIERFSEKGALREEEKTETLTSLLAPVAAQTGLPPESGRQPPEDEEAALEFPSRLLLAGNSLFSTYARIGGDLLVLGNTLQALHIVDGRAIESKQGRARRHFTDLMDYLAPVLNAPQSAYMNKGPQKLNRKQVDDILTASGRFNPGLYFQALMAGHVELARKFLAGLEVETGETILEAIQKADSDGAKILLKILGQHTDVVDHRMSEGEEKEEPART